MIAINGTLMQNGNIVWEIGEFSGIFDEHEDEIRIHFHFYADITLNEALKHMQLALLNTGDSWIFCIGKKWFVNLDELKKENIFFEQFIYLTGIVPVKPELEKKYELEDDKIKNNCSVIFSFDKADIENAVMNKIFLSHKGVDKPMVKSYKETLLSIGFHPWFDEDSLVAGDELERALLKGFKESCAAIFFITQNFVDDNYLASEINYAIQQKREKKERFSIITLVFGENIAVPDLLKSYVWKEPKSELEALREILKALPIKVNSIEYS